MKIVRIAATGAMLVAGMWCSAPLRAQTAAPAPEAVAAANELVGIISTDTMKQLAAGVTGRVWPQLEQGLRAKHSSIGPSQLSDLRAEYERLQVEFMVKIMEDAPAIYARHFTTTELRELIAFYHSPIGEKSLKVMPQVMAETLGLIAPRMQQMQTEVMAAFTKVLKEKGLDI